MAPLDAPSLAARLGISQEAAELYLSCDVIDLHVETFIWTRLFGYDLGRRHGLGPFGGRLFGQVDVPRLREARVTGAMWSIATNPFRTSAGRARAFRENFARLRGDLARLGDDVRLCRTASDYAASVREGCHAAFLSVQGGNALDHDEALLDEAGDELVRVTLVHLTRSTLGMTSTPSWRADDGLTARGKAMVEALNARRVFVDLAHVSRRGFFDAVEVHDRHQPILVTHTGVSGVHPHWRNIDDEQLRAVAATGGVVGVMYQSSFLGSPASSVGAEQVVRHLEHIAQVAGEAVPALGSDWDGFIFPPADLRSCLELPRLVEAMLRRGWSAERVRGVMGRNFLGALARLRT